MRGNRPLTEGHFQPSSAQPGVSGESRYAPYGPKAESHDDIVECKDEENMFDDNHKVHGGFAVGRTSGPMQNEKDVSSVQPEDQHL